MDAERATSLRRGLDILLVLGENEDSEGLGVVRIAELVDSDKSRVSRTLKTLAEYGLVERDPKTLAYTVGWRLFTMARGAADARLLAAGDDALEALVGELREGAHLSVPRGANVLTVLSHASAQTVQARSWVGRTIPAHLTSSGRALLLDHDRAALERLFVDAQLGTGGPNAPRDLDELHERILTARAVGFAVVDEETEPGLLAVGAPVRDFGDRIVAAVNVSGPRYRFEHRLDAAGPLVRAAAEDLSRRLGWNGGAATDDKESPTAESSLAQ